MNEYYIPAGDGEAEYVEKRSSFLGHVRMVETEDEAKAFVAAMKKKYYDARHNCWCYIIKDGAVRYSDDGEPQGTAGMPMLEVFKREKIENVVCVVTRYFGGVLLGAGGLFRAYTKSAKDALDAAGVSLMRRWAQGEISCSYSLFERIKLECLNAGGVIDDTEYGSSVTLKLMLSADNVEKLAERICNISAGTSELTVTGESFVPVRIK